MTIFFKLLFSLTIGASAFMIFWIQPMLAQQMTPLLGGTPSVWNTLLFVFQALLLCGYGYAYLLNRYAPPRHMLTFHMGLLALSLFMLPVGLTAGTTPGNTTQPMLWVIYHALLAVGMPFVLLAASAPLLQVWYGRSRASDAHDPYWLYAASNIGSLAALLAFPIVLQPAFSLPEQLGGWSIFYYVMCGLLCVCGFMVLRKANADISQKKPGQVIGFTGRKQAMLIFHGGGASSG